MKRIDDFKEREAMKIRIPGADLPDSMLTHKDGRVRVVQQITRQVRKFRKDLPCDLGVSLRWAEDIDPWRSDKHCNELPCLRYAPRTTHDPRMGSHAQELVKNRPSRIPCIRATTPMFKPTEAGCMIRRVFVSSIHQYIGIDDEHYRPSMAWYSASRSAISTSVPPL